MTTRIKITNEGPENAAVWYYGQDRVFAEHKDVVLVGQSIEIDVWDGHLPVLLPIGAAKTASNSGRFYSVPPAHY